jgi:hypothetical protein
MVYARSDRRGITQRQSTFFGELEIQILGPTNQFAPYCDKPILPAPTRRQTRSIKAMATRPNTPPMMALTTRSSAIQLAPRVGMTAQKPIRKFDHLPPGY